MKELQEIWDEMPKEAISPSKVDDYVTTKSNFELEKFGRIIKTELCLSIGIMVIVLVLNGQLNRDLVTIALIASIVGIPLGLFALKSLKRIKLTDDILDYLKSAIKFLKNYILNFIISVQLVLVLVFSILENFNTELRWDEWLVSREGITVVSVIIFIELFMLAYTRIFYFKRIKKINDLVTEIEQ